MKLSFSFLHINIIIFLAKFNNIISTSYKNEYINNITSDTIKNSKKKLSNEYCSIKNCLLCDNRNECIKCKEDYALYNKRCYSKNCEIYGFCRFCDEYDCLKCIKGYKLNYGICDQKEISRKKLYIIIITSFIIILIIVYICIRYNRLSKLRIATGQVIRFIHPKSGFYQLHYETENGGLDISNNKFLSTENQPTTFSEKPENRSPIVDKCVICENKNIYTIADCGCSICFEHYKIIKNEKKFICKVHKVLINSSITFKMVEKSGIKGNALKKLGLDKCPICKINDGTQSFNCGCSTKVCEKCFNDNVYVFKYKCCPGCGKEYIPIKKNNKKNNRKKVKSVEINIHRKKNIQNGNQDIVI